MAPACRLLLAVAVLVVAAAAPSQQAQGAPDAAPRRALLRGLHAYMGHGEAPPPSYSLPIYSSGYYYASPPPPPYYYYGYGGYGPAVPAGAAAATAIDGGRRRALKAFASDDKDFGHPVAAPSYGSYGPPPPRPPAHYGYATYGYGYYPTYGY